MPEYAKPTQYLKSGRMLLHEVRQANNSIPTVAKFTVGRQTVSIRKEEEYERRILNFDEWRQHKRFDDYGRKIEIEDPAETSAMFIAKMWQIRQQLKDYAEQGGACPSCEQALPAGWPNQSMAELVASGLVDPDELHDG